MYLRRRSSHEERGLKYQHIFQIFQVPKSLLSRGAWIEILCIISPRYALMSLLSRGAWIEIKNNFKSTLVKVSRSSHEERGLK